MEVEQGVGDVEDDRYENDAFEESASKRASVATGARKSDMKRQSQKSKGSVHNRTRQSESPYMDDFVPAEDESEQSARDRRRSPGKISRIS